MIRPLRCWRYWNILGLMKVIKLGGSLLADIDRLKDCLNAIELSSQIAVIVPGGGVFADQVREVQSKIRFDDQTAHQMAVLAMKQTALLLNSFKPGFILASSTLDVKHALNKSNVVIWSPCLTELNQSAVDQTWDVTSDSLSAWIAERLGATELIVVKSASIEEDLSINQMQAQGIVDKAFVQITNQASYKITIIHKSRFNEYVST